MAVLGIQWLFPAQLILDLATMAACFIASVKVGIVVMDLVWRSVLPGVELAFSTSIIAIITIGAVGRCLFGHSSRGGEELTCGGAGKGLGCWTDGA